MQAVGVIGVPICDPTVIQVGDRQGYLRFHFSRTKRRKNEALQRALR